MLSNLLISGDGCRQGVEGLVDFDSVSCTRLIFSALPAEQAKPELPPFLLLEDGRKQWK